MLALEDEGAWSKQEDTLMEELTAHPSISHQDISFL